MFPEKMIAEGLDQIGEDSCLHWIVDRGSSFSGDDSTPSKHSFTPGNTQGAPA
jgi:hypothetical protein